MPPLLWAAVRFDFKGAAVTLTLLALVTAVFTVSDASRFVGDAGSQREKQVMLHLFLAISALSALIVAVISRQHQLAVVDFAPKRALAGELVETLPAHIWCIAPDGALIYFSRQFRDFIGFDVKDVDGTSRLQGLLNAIVHPDDLGTVNAAVAQSLTTGEPCILKHRLRRFDGEYRWVETRAAPMRNAEGAIVQWNVICLDIDGEVRAQEELRLARERACTGEPGGKSCGAFGVDRPRGEPAAGRDRREFPCLPPLAVGRTRQLSSARKITAERIIRDANSAADVVQPHSRPVQAIHGDKEQPRRSAASWPRR